MNGRAGEHGDNAPITVMPHYPRYGERWGRDRGYTHFCTSESPRGVGDCTIPCIPDLRSYCGCAVCNRDSCSTWCVHWTMSDESKHRVLVCVETLLGPRNREVFFSGGKKELLSAMRERFRDVLDADAGILVQIQDESWCKGFFVDLLDQEIPDKAIIKALQTAKESFQVWRMLYGREWLLEWHLMYEVSDYWPWCVTVVTNVNF